MTDPNPILIFSPQYQAFRRFATARHGIITSARLISDFLQPRNYVPIMITLTYADRGRSAYVPRHLSDFLRRVRYRLHRDGLPCFDVWVLEDQKDSTPHYHLILWLPRNYRLPMPDKVGWWPHGSTRIEVARKAVRYIAAYAAKVGRDGRSEWEASLALPRHARVWGAGGLTPHMRSVVRWWHLPAHFRDSFGSDAQLVRCKGGGWVSRSTGEWHPPKYRLEKGDMTARRLTKESRERYGYRGTWYCALYPVDMDFLHVVQRCYPGYLSPAECLRNPFNRRIVVLGDL